MHIGMSIQNNIRPVSASIAAALSQIPETDLSHGHGGIRRAQRRQIGMLYLLTNPTTSPARTRGSIHGCG